MVFLGAEKRTFGGFALAGSFRKIKNDALRTIHQSCGAPGSKKQADLAFACVSNDAKESGSPGVNPPPLCIQEYHPIPSNLKPRFHSHYEDKSNGSL